MSCLECCVNVVVLKLDAMFCNITDIYELTVTLLGLVEDMLEMSEEKQVPTIGSCFEELAEVTLSHSINCSVSLIVYHFQMVNN